MRTCLHALFVVFFALCTLPIPGMSQERKATITGLVTDSVHDALVGARVELEPKGHIAITDTQGQFTISDVAPGDYKLRVTYVGFSTLIKSLHISAGEVTRVDAVLQVETVS